MENKKLWVLFVICLMSVSLFSGFVFAEDEQSDDELDNDNELDNDDEVDGVDESSETKDSVEIESVDENDTVVNAPAAVDKVTAAKVKSVKQSIEDRVSKKKELLERAKKSREEAKEAFNAAKDELKEARQKFQESRKNLNAVQKSVEKCKGVNSDECKKARKDNKTHVAKFVDGSVEQVYRMLERAKSAIESSGMNEEQKTQLVADFDAKLSELSALRQKQGQIQAQSSAQEVKTAAKNMKEFWSASKLSVKENNLKVSTGKLGGLVVKMEKLQARLSAEVVAFKNSGKDTAELDSMVALFNNKVSGAKKLNDEVQTLLDGVDSADDKSVVMKNATGKMQEAQVLLNDARNVLSDIRESMKAHEVLSEGIQQ